jgi:hypothetical protein
MAGTKQAYEVAEAFINGKRKSLGNYQSTGYSFLLFGNVIAEKCEDGFHIKDCGHCSQTTAVALNALPGVQLRRLHGEWIWNEKEKWDGKSKFIEYKH